MAGKKREWCEGQGNGGKDNERLGRRRTRGGKRKRREMNKSKK